MTEPIKQIPADFIDLPKYVSSPDHKYVYINGSRMGFSPWDFRIICSSAKDNNGDGVNEDQVTLIMSPQHAKVMLQNWITTIKGYEELFGLIPDLGAMLKAAKKKTKDGEAEKAESKKTASGRNIRMRK